MFDQTYKILVVDDQPSTVKLLRYKLVKKGFDVITAENGEDAIELCHEENPDLIISDIAMPVMDGYTLCRKINSISNLEQIPVILLTSTLNTESLMKGIEAGADNYLTKPYDSFTLFSKIEELINRPAEKNQDIERKEVTIEGKEYNIEANWPKILSLLISTYNNSVAQKAKLEKTKRELNETLDELKYAREEHQELLHNIFPAHIAEKLIAFNKVRPEFYENVSILFTDFSDFSSSVRSMNPDDFIEKLSYYFDTFDTISAGHNVEKIKTIGDSYMAVGGLPERNSTHPVDTALTALQILKFAINEKKEKQLAWNIRIGIHTGEALVGVIGQKRLAYDIWGSSVNLASRMEEAAEINCINISEDTYNRVKDFFECEYRGEVEAKKIGRVPMYFLHRIRPDLSEDDEGFTPNRQFINQYRKKFQQGETES